MKFTLKQYEIKIFSEKKIIGSVVSISTEILVNTFEEVNFHSTHAVPLILSHIMFQKLEHISFKYTY